MSLQTVRLSKASLANVTLIRLLSSVDPQMSFQFERIRTGIGTVRALKENTKTITVVFLSSYVHLLILQL